MKLELEEDLWNSIRLRGGQGGTPREWAERALADGRITSIKQVIAVLRKWPPDVYDYGISELAGWRCCEHNPHIDRRRAQEDAIARCESASWFPAPKDSLCR